MKTLAELQREQDEYATGFGGYTGKTFEQTVKEALR